jgi:hypothetical protein
MGLQLHFKVSTMISFGRFDFFPTIGEYYTTSHYLGFTLCVEINRYVILTGAKSLPRLYGDFRVVSGMSLFGYASE